MDQFILENSQEEGLGFVVGVLMERRGQLTKRRTARGNRYALIFLLAVILLARLAREGTPKGIADWLKLRRQQIMATFNLKRPHVRFTHCYASI